VQGAERIRPALTYQAHTQCRYRRVGLLGGIERIEIQNLFYTPMIDGIKLEIDPQAVRNSDVLEFQRVSDNSKTAKYKGMVISLHPDSCYIRGSIHKYHNGGNHNANDFRLTDFIQALNDLSATLGFEPAVTRFHTLEFGVNVDLPFEAHRLIGSVLYYNNGAITTDRKGLTINFEDYDVKIYLKEIKTPEEPKNSLLRYEVKIKRIRRMKRIAGGEVFCSTLQDLTNPALWRLLGNELLSVYDGILIVDRDAIDVQSLNKEELELYVKGSNPGYWLGDWGYRLEKKRELKQFRDIVAKHSQSTMKSEVRGLIAEKINSLIDVPICNDFTKIESRKESGICNDFTKIGNVKGCKFCNDSHTWITAENVTNLKPNLHFCEITNLPLDIGIKQHSYLSAKGVEYYYKNHHEIYENVLLPRLSKKWLGEPPKIQFREIAHSIRNEKYNPGNNPRNNTRRSINRVLSEGSLIFSLAETIAPSKRRYLQGAI
jgi:hypothetical protein